MIDDLENFLIEIDPPLNNIYRTQLSEANAASAKL